MLIVETIKLLPNICENNSQLSQRDRVAVGPEVENWNWETIFYGQYRSIFNHCDVIGQQSNRIRLKMQNKGYYALQGHSRSSRSSIESPYATSC